MHRNPPPGDHPSSPLSPQPPQEAFKRHVALARQALGAALGVVVLQVPSTFAASKANVTRVMGWFNFLALYRQQENVGVGACMCVWWMDGNVPLDPDPDPTQSCRC